MKLQKRYLPSMHYLLAFDAAARSGSFSAAARELDLSQSAVSKQVAALEYRLDSLLFVRDRQRVKLTPSGERYAQEIHAALQRISRASMDLRANPQGGTLALAILPTFGTRWLAPRLADFQRQNPGVTLNLVTHLRPFDFAREQLDAAIAVGDGDWSDTQKMRLLNETLIPAYSPALYQQLKPLQAKDLQQMPLLGLATRPDAWKHWFSAQGIDQKFETQMVFDQFATAAQAAISGLGVALLPDFLIAEELSDGRLITPSWAMRRSQHQADYWLLWPNARSDYPPLQAFRRWLGSQVALPN